MIGLRTGVTPAQMRGFATGVGSKADIGGPGQEQFENDVAKFGNVA